MDLMIEPLEKAVQSFSRLVNADLTTLSTTLEPYLLDGLQNGKAQKFEYTLELSWKTIKVFLKKQEGIDEATPKKIAKAFYLGGYLAEDDYLSLIQAIDDRNKLSHIYNETDFDLIVSRLPGYARLMERIADTLRGIGSPDSPKAGTAPVKPDSHNP